MQTVIKIQKGWFRSAGSHAQYGWELMGYEPEGVGINRDALYQNKELVVEVNGDRYKVDCAKAINFIKTFKSHKKMPHGTKVGIISKSLMQKI